MRDDRYVERVVGGKTFYQYFNVNRADMSVLWQLFMDYGMTNPNAPEQSKGNHYFLQGIVEHNVVEWKDWKNKLTPTVKAAIEEKYPQFMVTCRKFNKSNTR